MSSALSSTSASDSEPPSVTVQLDRLTSAIQDVGSSIQECKQTSDERWTATFSRDEQKQAHTSSMQAQLAQMLAMTQESLRKGPEEGVQVPGTFAKDLQRAAFGAGGDSETASRSSMLESRESDH